MDLDKSEVIAWLKKEGKTRQWLARQFNVSVRTIGNWLDRSDRDIPERHLPRIAELMKISSENKHVLSIELTTEEFQHIESRAQIAKLTILEYVKAKVTT